MNECELGGFGTVRPYGVVSVGDVEFWDDGPDRSRAGWWYWFANVAIVAVDPGVNALDFVATYEDGTTLTDFSLGDRHASSHHVSTTGCVPRPF